jgi:hypothetical protein
MSICGVIDRKLALRFIACKLPSPMILGLCEMSASKSGRACARYRAFYILARHVTHTCVVTNTLYHKLHNNL